LRRRKTLAWWREYEADQWLKPDEIAGLQWQKLKRLLGHCYREVPYYRQLWQSQDIHPDDVRSMADFAKLPTLGKDDIRKNFDALQAESFRGRLLLKNTGGSTGVPLRFGYTRESHDRRAAVMWRGYAWAGARMGRRTLLLWGGAVGDPGRAHLLKERLYHAAYHRRILNSFAMSEANMAEYADAVDLFKPEVIVAYVAPLVRLAQWALATQHKLHRPDSIVCAAEPLLEFQRGIIEQAFGCPVYNTYGCREFMLIASECEQRDGLHVNADHLCVELGNATQAGGEVVVTDLHNYGMPFIRYVNGDLASPMPGVCACGRGLPRLGKVQGRKLDVLRTPDGHLLPGEFFPHMLKDVSGLLMYQVVQRHLDQFDMTLVRGEGFDNSALDYIRREVRKVVGDSVRLDFQFSEHIDPGPTGKHRVTRCELP
jgi:phenylacetate-CoA ligase